MKFIKTSILIVLLAFLGACNQGQQNQEGSSIETVRIGSFFTAVDYAPYIVAKNKGWFKEAFDEKGIKVEFKTFQTLPTLNEALATNNVDVLFEAEPPAIVGKAAGIDLKIVDISCSINLGILVRSDSKIITIEDLKGQKIALLAGTGVHYGVLKILEERGIDKNEVDIVDMLPPDAKSAFETGSIDAWAVWSPFIDQAVLNGTGRILAGDSFQIQSIMVARGDFLKNNEEEFNTVKKVFDRSQDWIEQNPDEAKKIVAQELDLSMNVIESAWSRHIWEAEITPRIIQDIQNKATFLYNEGFIENQIDVSQGLFWNAQKPSNHNENK